LLVFAFLSDFRSCGLPVSYEFLTATLMECYHRQAGNGQPETIVPVLRTFGLFRICYWSFNNASLHSPILTLMRC
jgi:hypothetical protein